MSKLEKYSDKIANAIETHWNVAHMAETAADAKYRWNAVASELEGIRLAVNWLMDDEIYEAVLDDIQILKLIAYQHRLIRV